MSDKRCTCATDGNASRCPHHTQADFNAASVQKVYVVLVASYDNYTPRGVFTTPEAAMKAFEKDQNGNKREWTRDDTDIQDGGTACWTTEVSSRTMDEYRIAEYELDKPEMDLG